jgi:hypothetical protein
MKYIDANLKFQNNFETKKLYEQNLAPVAIFAYNRINHLKTTINLLRNNVLSQNTNIYIFSDGHNDNKSDDFNKVKELREYVKIIDGFKSVTIIEREKNYGLAKSIVSGIDLVINIHGKVIVLEDDICTSPYFLKYMNDALYLYENETKVFQIGGFMPQIFEQNKFPETFFLPWTTSWGWGTWKRSWDFFENDSKKVINDFNIKDKHILNFYGTDKSLWKQIINNHKGKINTWAIFFAALVVKKRGYVLYTNESVCWNIGFDGSGENCGIERIYYPKRQKVIEKFDCEVKFNDLVIKKIIKKNKVKFFLRLFNNIRSIAIKLKRRM